MKTYIITIRLKVGKDFYSYYSYTIASHLEADAIVGAKSRFTKHTKHAIDKAVSICVQNVEDLTFNRTKL